MECVWVKPAKFDYLNPKIFNEVLKSQQIDDVKLIVSEQNISSAKNKEVIHQDNQVLDCAVVGISHETLGEVPLAFLVLRDKNIFNQKQLIDFCTVSLSTYKIPEKFQIVDNIPRTGSGKIMRYKLKKIPC